MNDPSDAAISIRNLTFQYRIREEPAIQNVDLDLYPGELMLVVGASGSGKSTVMRCINGLIPRSYRGEMQGEVKLFGKNIQSLSMAQLSQMVGTLLQDPERQIVTSYVRNEVAFGLENLARPREQILSQIDETLQFLNIQKLKERATFELSGGEKQIVSVAGVLAMQPRILLLDEPLASLDPATAQESLTIFRALANQGIAVMLVEHRVDSALSINPDKVVYLEDGKIAYAGDAAGLMKTADYRKVKLPAPIIMKRAKATPFQPIVPKVGAIAHDDDQETKVSETKVSETLVSIENINFRYSPDTRQILHNISTKINKGDIVAVLGPNGSGKTTFMKQILGLLKPTEGAVKLSGIDNSTLSVAQAAQTVGYVFQNPSQMLFAPTVDEELEFGPKNLGQDTAVISHNIDWAIQTVNMTAYRESPPLALSYGQQKRVSIAAILAMRSRILAMDEPTAGQDYWNYRAFMDGILQMPGFDAILFITHDLDLALTYATRILLISDGRLVADGPTPDVLDNDNLLRQCRILPTTLLEINRKHYPQTGRFMRAEELTHLVESEIDSG